MLGNRLPSLLLGFCLCLPLVLCNLPIPLWNTYKWGSNHQAWCRFRCGEKIAAGNLFQIDLSGSTSGFKEFGNLKVLNTNGTSYIVENKFDIWPWSSDGFCQFQFGLTYHGTTLQGNCSFYEPATTETRPARGIEVAKWSNNRALGSRLWRYKGRCMVPCTGTYKPGTLRVNVDVDKGTTNFNGQGMFSPTIKADSLSRSWSLVNDKIITSSQGLCQFDIAFDHQSEFPEPKGSCYVM